MWNIPSLAYRRVSFDWNHNGIIKGSFILRPWLHGSWFHDHLPGHHGSTAPGSMIIYLGTMAPRLLVPWSFIWAPWLHGSWFIDRLSGHLGSTAPGLLIMYLDTMAPRLLVRFLIEIITYIFFMHFFMSLKPWLHGFTAPGSLIIYLGTMAPRLLVY